MRSSLLDDTIVALATAPGRAALAVVRVSGRETRRLIAAASPELPAEPTPRHAYLVAVVDAAGEPIDRGLVTFFAAPFSYTGEEAAEVSVHGAPRVVDRLLAALTGAGARLARPGEFTERALLHGKMDLLEAEAVQDLVDARTEAAARVSARRLAGALSRRLSGVRELLLRAAASLTATIDFAEDVGDSVDPAVARDLQSAGETLEKLAASYEAGRLLSAGCRVAILGRPNAGKSTIFNSLVGSPRAIVTDIPGTTRDAIDATLDVSGVPVTLVDTAGLRATEDPVESIGVSRAHEEALRADAVLYVFDAAAGLREEDQAALSTFAADDKPVFLVANKIDTVRPGAAPPDGATPLCGVAPEAAERLHGLLAERLFPGLSLEAADEVLGNARQRDLVLRARRAAADALEALCRGDSPEYAASHVDSALVALADVFGETTAENVLQRIFATFCIGK
ncbi:MAG TPA: tRNA uridine-5-carboxymethylaminomethyl(34) synthesis GTPase MnmE [Thermoanaerobaculia bacterium]|nr:tRNA uridine-5-carboxymethylaminomethyl(34) synthesis GTPase MnmE [Thermoanaerobaculia bacterium]